jgi:hypothetical protein
MPRPIYPKESTVVGPRTGIHVVAKSKALHCRESNSDVHLVAESLYRLSYPSSQHKNRTAISGHVYSLETLAGRGDDDGDGDNIVIILCIVSEEHELYIETMCTPQFFQLLYYITILIILKWLFVLVYTALQVLNFSFSTVKERRTKVCVLLKTLK